MASPKIPLFDLPKAKKKRGPDRPRKYGSKLGTNLGARLAPQNCPVLWIGIARINISQGTCKE